MRRCAIARKDVARHHRLATVRGELLEEREHGFHLALGCGHESAWRTFLRARVHLDFAAHKEPVRVSKTGSAQIVGQHNAEPRFSRAQVLQRVVRFGHRKGFHCGRNPMPCAELKHRVHRGRATQG